MKEHLLLQPKQAPGGSRTGGSSTGGSSTGGSRTGGISPVGTCQGEREVLWEGGFFQVLPLYWTWLYQVLWQQTCGSWEEGEEERGKGVMGEYTPEGV